MKRSTCHGGGRGGGGWQAGVRRPERAACVPSGRRVCPPGSAAIAHSPDTNVLPPGPLRPERRLQPCERVLPSRVPPGSRGAAQPKPGGCTKVGGARRRARVVRGERGVRLPAGAGRGRPAVAAAPLTRLGPSQADHLKGSR